MKKEHFIVLQSRELEKFRRILNKDDTRYHHEVIFLKINKEIKVLELLAGNSKGALRQNFGYIEDLFAFEME